MADIVKLQPKTPPAYDPRADRREEQAAQGHDAPQRTKIEEAIYQDWVRKGRPDDWPRN